VSDGLSGTFGHSNFLPIFVDTNNLVNFNFQGRFRIAFHHNGALHAVDITMVVSAKQIDAKVESTAQFIVVIADIRHEIGVRTIFFDNRAILVIKESGRLQISGTILNVNVATFPQIINRVGNGCSFTNFRFIRKLIKADMEICHVFFDFCKFGIDAKTDKEIVGFFGVLKILLAILIFY